MAIEGTLRHGAAKVLVEARCPCRSRSEAPMGPEVLLWVLSDHLFKQVIVPLPKPHCLFNGVRFCVESLLPKADKLETEVEALADATGVSASGVRTGGQAARGTSVVVTVTKVTVAVLPPPPSRVERG